VIYINAAPESYVKFVSDPGNLRHFPFPEFLAIKNFSNPPQLSDLQGFELDSDDIKALRDCKPGKCEIQLPASTAMDELRKSVNWSAPNVDEQVNQLLQKLALSRLQDYQKEGSRTFGEVYNDKGQKVPVADQFSTCSVITRYYPGTFQPSTSTSSIIRTQSCRMYKTPFAGSG
jgi:hypothetical protein